MELMILILLTVLVLEEVARLIISYTPRTKKSYFKHRLIGVDNLIWDLEFKRFKTKEIREEIRKEYAQVKSRLFKLEEDIKVAKDSGVKKDDGLGALEDTKALLERDSKRFEEQMTQLDVETDGAKKSQENPDGTRGIAQELDSLREVKGMLQDWVKGL